MVVDTSAMLSIILHVTDELAMATRVGEAVAAVMPAATYVELSILAKTWGRLGLDMLDSALAEAGIEVVSVSVSQARLAAEAYARYGKGRGHPARLNYGDCFAYALAKERDEPLLFKGNDFSQTDIGAAI